MKDSYQITLRCVGVRESVSGLQAFKYFLAGVFWAPFFLTNSLSAEVWDGTTTHQHLRRHLSYLHLLFLLLAQLDIIVFSCFPAQVIFINVSRLLHRSSFSSHIFQLSSYSSPSFSVSSFLSFNYNILHHKHQGKEYHAPSFFPLSSPSRTTNHHQCNHNPPQPPQPLAQPPLVLQNPPETRYWCLPFSSCRRFHGWGGGTGTS